MLNQLIRASTRRAQQSRLCSWPGSQNLAPLPPKSRWLPPGRRSASRPSIRPGCKCAPAAATALIGPCRPTQGAGWPLLSAAASGEAKERYDRIMRKYRCHGRGAGPANSDLDNDPRCFCTIGKRQTAWDAARGRRARGCLPPQLGQAPTEEPLPSSCGKRLPPPSCSASCSSAPSGSPYSTVVLWLFRRRWSKRRPACGAGLRGVKAAQHRLTCLMQHQWVATILGNTSHNCLGPTRDVSLCSAHRRARRS